MADAMKTAGQYMEQETPHEFTGIQRHGLVARASLGAVILPTEGDMVLIHGDQTRVGDGDAVGVTGQVGQHDGRTGEGPFGVDHPFTAAHRFEPLGEGVGVGQGRELTEELQLTVGVCLGQAFEEEPSKQS